MTIRIVRLGSPRHPEEGLRIGALQQRLGLRVAVDATSVLHSFFDGSPGTLHVTQEGEPFRTIRSVPDGKWDAHSLWIIAFQRSRHKWSTF